MIALAVFDHSNNQIMNLVVDLIYCMKELNQILCRNKKTTEASGSARAKICSCERNK